MTFCPSCGAERREGTNFCHNCGYDFKKVDAARANINTNSSPNSSPNSNLNSNNTINSNTNSGGVPTNQNSHRFTKILGYIFAILIPIIGIIIGIYLWMSENEDVQKHGKIIIGIGIAIQLISLLSVMLY